MQGFGLKGSGPGAQLLELSEGVPRPLDNAKTFASPTCQRSTSRHDAGPLLLLFSSHLRLKHPKLQIQYALCPMSEH